MNLAPIFRIVLLSVLTHTAYKGSKVLMSLTALDMGANVSSLACCFRPMRCSR